MSRAEPPTHEEIRQAFEEQLAHYQPVTETGLDERTWEALAAVWRSGPNPPPELIEAARAALEAQLDGTHAALDAAEEAAIIRETARRYGRPTCEGSVAPD